VTYDRHNIAVIIPALNERLRIREVVEGALRHADRVIVIDDGSDDGTGEAVGDLAITLLRHETRQGKGASLRDGFAEALRQGVAAAISMDGDGQHSAEDIPRLLAAANRRPGWIVIGARLRKRSQQPTYRRLANEFGDWGVAWGTGYQIADSQSGQRFYPANVMALGDVPGEDFVYEAQILMSAAQQLGVRCVSIPIEARYNEIHDTTAFRPSHFKPLRDFSLITSHIVWQCLKRGGIPAMYRSIRANPPVIDDADGTLDDVAAGLRQAG